ncbi:DeoR/GlpR family DNA-binding transcription regulator [Paenibacillus sp. strain BS8-2]
MSGRLNERQQLIMEWLGSEGEARIPDMSVRFNVTEMTIRRDLEKLEQEGLVKRTLGGAIPLGKDIALKERTGVMSAEKAAIGRLAASLIQPGDYVFFDGGTTTIEVARALRPDYPMTAVTNALNVAAELQEKRIPTIVTGGMILEATSTLIGPFAENLIGSMAYSRVFLGTTGITPGHGFSNSNMYEAEIKKAAIRQAAEVNILADATKFGARDLFSFAELSQASRIIANAEPEESLKQACGEHGVTIMTE